MLENDTKSNKKDKKPFPPLSELVKAWWEEKDPILYTALVAFMGFFGWVCYLFAEPVNSQVKEYAIVASEFPIEKDRRLRIEVDVKEIKVELKQLGSIINDIHADQKAILRNTRAR